MNVGLVPGEMRAPSRGPPIRNGRLSGSVLPTSAVSLRAATERAPRIPRVRILGRQPHGAARETGEREHDDHLPRKGKAGSDLRARERGLLRLLANDHDLLGLVLV